MPTITFTTREKQFAHVPNRKYRTGADFLKDCKKHLSGDPLPLNRKKQTICPKRKDDSKLLDILLRNVKPKEYGT